MLIPGPVIGRQNRSLAENGKKVFLTCQRKTERRILCVVRKDGVTNDITYLLHIYLWPPLSGAPHAPLTF